jgi:hypothetical protein
MLRVLLYVTLLSALFVGTVLYAGNAMGAWDPANLPVHAPDTSSTGKAKPKKHAKHEHSAKPEKKR